MNLRLFTSFAASLFALGAGTVCAQITGSETNYCNFFLQLIEQGPSTSTNGVTTYDPPEIENFNASTLIGEIGAATGHTFSSGAKFGFVNWQPWVLDGNNSMSVPTNMVGFQVGDTKIISGTQNNSTGLAFPKLADQKRVTFYFNNSSAVGGSHYQFSATGLALRTVTDTVPNPTTGLYTDTDKGSEIEMVGEGFKGSKALVVKGKATSLGIALWRIGPTGPTSEK